MLGLVGGAYHCTCCCRQVGPKGCGQYLHSWLQVVVRVADRLLMEWLVDSRSKRRCIYGDFSLLIKYGGPEE